MSDGDARDRWASDRRNPGQRGAPGVRNARRDDERPTQGRGSRFADGAPMRRVAPGAPRPTAPTRPLPPTDAPARRGAYGPPRSDDPDYADDARAMLAAERARRASPARSQAGWRRFTPIILGLVAGIAVVALGLGALIIFAPRAPQPQAPSVTTQALCADLTTQNYASAYALLSPRLQAQGSQTQFVASQRELDALQGNVTTCSPVIVNVAGSSASASVQVTRAHAKLASAAVTLTLVGASWRVDTYDTSVI